LSPHDLNGIVVFARLFFIIMSNDGLVYYPIFKW